LSEQRKFSRKLVFLKVVIEGPDGVRSSGLATDLSIGGMFVGVAKQYPFGTAVSVELLFEPPVRIPATVRWNKPEGLGLQFGLLGVRETTQILDLVKAASQP
jgi:Tfp pilus assembly protein PilZ